MHTRAGTLLPSVRYGTHIDLNKVSVALGRLDIHSVTMRDSNQIGINRTVAVLPNTGSQKFVNRDGSQITVLIIKSSGASGIGLHFRNFALAAGEEVYVYGIASDSIVCGPYVNNGPWGSREFWSGTLAGDTAIIEFYTPGGKKAGKFEIVEVSHIFPELALQLQAAAPDVTPLPCEVDASCNPNSLNNAVGRILFNNNGPHVCTGTLLNDRNQDLIPYFLTANHCVPSEAVAQTVEVWWFYQTTSCNSGMLRSDWVHDTDGADLLATQSTNDFSLLRFVTNPPAGTYFSGWEPNVQATGTSVFSLHHPEGYYPPDVESYLRRASGTITNTNSDCLGMTNGYYTSWTSGTTEPGSSGSGLFNSNGDLVGILSCGPGPTPICSNAYALQSKFANFYSQIQRYLDGHPAFFTGEVPVGDGAYYLQLPNGTPFGYYSYLTALRWIYHFDMGYEYWFDANDGRNGIFFYDSAANTFFYTSPSLPFPYLYDFGLNALLYYYPDASRPGHYTTNPRYFYNFATHQIITR